MNDSLGVSNDSTMASKSHETKPIFESGTVPHRETDAAAQSSMSQGGISFATPDDTVEGTAEKLLESAVEDGPGEDWSTIERKVCTPNVFVFIILPSLIDTRCTIHNLMSWENCYLKERKKRAT